MKKIRLLLPLLLVFVLPEQSFSQADCSLNIAVVCEDFEGYDNTMPLGPQSDDWTTWSGDEGGAEDGIVSTDQASSGTQSLSIVGAAGGGPQDVVLLLGDLTSGRYRVQFKLFVPEGKAAYYNIQKYEVVNTEFAFQVTFNADGTAQLDAGAQAAVIFGYEQDTWIVVDQIIDLDNDWTTLSVGGRPVYSWPYSYQALSTDGTLSVGSFDFFPLDAEYEYFIDDVFLEPQPDCSLDPETIICDDIEAYGGSTYAGPNSSFWTTWQGLDGTAEDAIVSDDQAASGSYSLLIEEGQTQDPLLLLGNKEAGTYTLQWMEYIPAGATAYYNIQEDEEPGLQWNMDVFFNDGGGAPGTGIVDQTGATFTYPEDAWFMVRQVIDLDDGGLALYIDGTLADASLDFTGLRLGSIDFFSIDATNVYYLDNVLYKEGADCAQFDAITAEGSVTDATAGEDNGTATATASGGLGEYTYLWSNGEITSTITDLAPGEYSCLVSPAASFGGCIEAVSVTVNVGEFTDVSEVDLVEQLKIAPNPTSGELMLELDLLESAEVSVEILNVAGQRMAVYPSQVAKHPSFQMDLSAFADGLYFARINVGTTVLVEKIVLNK